MKVVIDADQSQVYVNPGGIYEHRVIAKKALGKPLPKAAVVHHVNSIRSDNRPENLVICPDQKCHVLLHMRTKAYEAGVDYDTHSFCSYHQEWHPKMKVVIDADMSLYACGFSAKGEPLSHVLHLIKKRINGIIEQTEADSFEVYVEGKGNFREEVALDYKGNRKGEKPEFFKESKQFLIDHFGATLVTGMETDDMVSYLLYQDFKKHNGDLSECEVILSSPDKDLNNTPGWHHNPMTGEVKWIDEEDALLHFLKQALSGDRVDNIPGLPYATDEMKEKFNLRSRKVGKATAQSVIEGCSVQKAWSNVKECYLSWGTEEGYSEEATRGYLEQQCQLLWMTREINDGVPVRFNLKTFEANHEASH